MATAVKVITQPMNSVTTTAAVRSFLTDFYAFLNDLGLVQRADTGQADPLTATFTSGAFYHSVWNLSDGGTSIVFRFSWRAFSNTMQFYGNIGTGTDGAGVLTGPLTEFSSLATPSTSAGSANSGYVNTFAGDSAAMQFMGCRIPGDGYLYFEMSGQAQNPTSVNGGCFAFWRRKGYEGAGHCLSFSKNYQGQIATITQIKPPHTPGTGAAYNIETSGYKPPIWVPWGRTGSEPDKVNFFPFKVLFPVAAGYGHDTQRPVCAVYTGEHTIGDLIDIDLDGDGVRTYRVSVQRSSSLGIVNLAFLWE